MGARDHTHTHTHTNTRARALMPSDISLAGFIPRSQHFFGNRYANVCRNSVSDFEFDQRKYEAKRQELRLVEAAQSGRTQGMDPSSLPVCLEVLPSFARIPLWD